jgi:hypothetical protein
MSRKGNKSPFSHDPKSYGRDPNSQQIVRAVVNGAQSYTSTAGGTLSIAVPLDPSTLTTTDWGDFSATYDQFRVIGAQIDLICRLPNVTSANNIAVMAFDNDSTPAPTFALVNSYGTSRIFSSIIIHDEGKPLTQRWWRPTSGARTEILWCDVATPSQSLGSIMLYADGLQASTAYWDVAFKFFIEFRGRR